MNVIGIVLDAVTIIIAIIAIFISVKANRNSKEANVNSERANALASGEIEISIANSIRETENRVSDIASQIAFLTPDQKQDNSIIETMNYRLGQAQEANLNSYDEACAKYKDNKVDKERFRKNYFHSIKNIVEDEDLNKKYFNSVTSKYECIIYVYNEWHKLER